MDAEELPPIEIKPATNIIVRRDEVVNGLYMREVETRNGEYWIFAEDRTPEKKYITGLSELCPTTNLTGAMRAWFVGSINVNTVETRTLREITLAKNELAAKISALCKDDAEEDNSGEELFVCKHSFNSVLPGKRLSDICHGIHVAKQGKEAVIIYGRKAGKDSGLLKQYGKYVTSSRCGEEGWLVKYEQYESLLSSFGK